MHSSAAPPDDVVVSPTDLAPADPHAAPPPADAPRAATPAGRAARLYQAGMTLIEIMIVLAILALIMGFLVGPRVLASFKDAKVKTARLMAKDYLNAYSRWVADNDEQCPAGLEDLRKYRDKKDDKDPWGGKFEMLCGDNAPEGEDFGVVSPGPDRKSGTGDDIKSWDDGKK